MENVNLLRLDILLAILTIVCGIGLIIIGIKIVIERLETMKIKQPEQTVGLLLFAIWFAAGLFLLFQIAKYKQWL